ncbi:MAG: calcium/sodium antiporter [Eubacteriales bacterium]
MNFILQAVLLVVGFTMLIKGADWFVEGASKVADRFGIPQIIIGLTIVAMGTSAPEAAISISAAMKGSAAITIGNVLGSNILNVLIILGITAIVTTLPVQKSTLKVEMPFVIFISALLPFLGLVDGVIGRLDAVILSALFIAFFIYLFKTAKNGVDVGEEVDNETKDEKLGELVFLIILGMGLIVWGSDVTVNAATEIARMFGMSERIIGLTIVAFGTSLPELITSVTAAKKGKADIAIGNIIGSNIFNILFVVGMTGLITPVVYSTGFLIDSAVCTTSAILLLVCVLKNEKLTKNGGILLVLSYAAYFVYLIRG